MKNNPIDSAVRQIRRFVSNRSNFAFRHHNWKLIAAKESVGFTHWGDQQKNLPAPERPQFAVASNASEKYNLGV